MSRIQFSVALLGLCLAIGCKAQPSPQSGSDLLLNRHIEVMVRSQFNVPQDFIVTLGDRSPSQVPGYLTLPITLSHGANKTHVDFLISSDGKTLARLETFDLAKDPLFTMDITGRPIRGNPAGKVTVVSFDDLECPYCSRMHQTIFPGTMDRYRDKVRFIYKDDPLVDIHPWAMHAAVDANCLAMQSASVYWDYVDYLHAHGDEVSGADRSVPKSFDALNRIARQQGTLGKLDSTRLDACLAAQDETQVRASMKEAESLRIDGTPALFVDGERISGLVPESVLWKVIDRALIAAGVDLPSTPATVSAAAASGK